MLIGWLPLTGPVTVPPQALFIVPALNRLLSLRIDPALLMVLPLELDTDPEITNSPKIIRDASNLPAVTIQKGFHRKLTMSSLRHRGDRRGKRAARVR